MRVTVADIEATSLEGGFGRLLCCSFVDIGSDEVTTFRRDTRPWRKGRWSDNDDSRLAVAIRKRIEAADILVTWNGKMYDVPFVNARLTAAGESPIRLGKDHGSSHLDLMWFAGGSQQRAGSKRLDNVAKFYGVKHSKTSLDVETWSRAAAGDRAALDKIVEHCEADVLVTRDVYPHLAPHVKGLTYTFSEVWKFIDHVPSRRVGAAEPHHRPASRGVR